MIFFGWDPGKKGAVVVGDECGGAAALPMTLAGDRKTYITTIVAEWIRGMGERGPMFFAIEDNHGMPARNSKGKVMSSTYSNFEAGVGRGIIEGILGALGLDVMDPKQVLWVPPRRWQAFHFGPEAKRTKPTKAMSKARALSLFPDLKKWQGPRGALSDGITDAALIMDYGRRYRLASR